MRYGGGAALAEALAARAAQLADDGDVNAKACLEALGALVLWRAKACLDNIDDAGDAEPLDAVIVACADGAARALACRYEAPTLALKGGDLHDLELREDDENTMQVTRAALDVVAVLAAAAHPGLKERQGLECLALPVETDAQLCSLVADACRRGDVSSEPCAHVRRRRAARDARADGPLGRRASESREGRRGLAPFSLRDWPARAPTTWPACT